MLCRHCRSEVRLPFIDLGAAPPSNAYLDKTGLERPETWYPLKVLVCEQCWLAQTQDYAHFADLFAADYAYFSSTSSTWLAHAEQYVTDMTQRFALGSSSQMVEIAANDGYLLQYAKVRGIPCLGIEPTASTATAGRAKGIDIVEEFFGRELAARLSAEGLAADLMAANNVLAHVPDINDFVGGFTILLKTTGVATFEFPHLLHMVQQSQFDTIYHEHFSYLSLTAVSSIFKTNGLSVFDIETLHTHGGSLRVFAQRKDGGTQGVSARVAAMLDEERAAGITTPAFYAGLQNHAERIKDDLLLFLIEQKRMGKKVAAYGAAAKGNTLLNYAGIRPDLISFVCDAAPSKQGRYLPGSHIPILPPATLRVQRPDTVLILPWNIAGEVRQQHGYIGEWGGRFAVAVPSLSVLP